MKLLLILLLSLAVRLTIPSTTPVSGIAQAYRDLAAHLRAGQGYTMPDGSTPSQYTTPGYALAKAVFGD